MLYVLTCCDLRAVSNDSWNDWRGMLLANLYEATMNVLTGRPSGEGPHTPSNEEVAATLAAQRVEAIANGNAQAPSREEIMAFLADLPARYRQTTPPEHLERHVRMARGLNDNSLLQLELEPVEGTNYSELHCVARDSPGLFRHLCGAMASRGYNILSAQVVTARDGTCVDVFQVQDHLHNPPTDHGVAERLRERLNQVLRGEREANWKPAQPQQKPISPARLDQRPPSCLISNDPSGEGSTLIEVKAPDRPGLLYDLATVLDTFRLNIHLALIATESYQVVDVFYVTDLENARLEPGSQTEALRKALLDAVNATPVESPMATARLRPN
jgi:[protein-PII] uridylyltransferase